MSRNDLLELEPFLKRHAICCASPGNSDSATVSVAAVANLSREDLVSLDVPADLLVDALECIEHLSSAFDASDSPDNAVPDRDEPGPASKPVVMPTEAPEQVQPVEEGTNPASLSDIPGSYQADHPGDGSGSSAEETKDSPPGKPFRLRSPTPENPMQDAPQLHQDTEGNESVIANGLHHESGPPVELDEGRFESYAHAPPAKLAPLLGASSQLEEVMQDALATRGNAKEMKYGQLTQDQINALLGPDIDEDEDEDDEVDGMGSQSGQSISHGNESEDSEMDQSGDYEGENNIDEIEQQQIASDAASAAARMLQEDAIATAGIRAVANGRPAKRLAASDPDQSTERRGVDALLKPWYDHGGSDADQILPSGRADPIRDSANTSSGEESSDEDYVSDSERQPRDSVDDDVGDWLASIGCYHCADEFARAGYATMKRVRMLTRRHLEIIGISEADVPAIMVAVRSLQDLHEDKMARKRRLRLQRELDGAEGGRFPRSTSTDPPCSQDLEQKASQQDNGIARLSSDHEGLGHARPEMPMEDKELDPNRPSFDDRDASSQASDSVGAKEEDLDEFHAAPPSPGASTGYVMHSNGTSPTLSLKLSLSHSSPRQSSAPLQDAFRAAEVAAARETRKVRPKKMQPNRKTASSQSKHARRLAEARRRQEEAKRAKDGEFGT